MDIVWKLIICVVLGAFYAPTVSAYEFHDPYPNVKVIDGEVHIQRPGGGTTLAYPNAGISKEIPVNTSKGQFLVPVEKTFPVEPSKVGKAATRFLKTLPAIGTAIALYDTVCDLSDLCVHDGQLKYKEPSQYDGWPSSTPVTQYRVNLLGIYGPTPDIACSALDSVSPYSTYGPYTLVTKTGPLRYECDGLSPFNGLAMDIIATCHSAYSYDSGSGQCVLSSADSYRDITESDWSVAETKLNAQPQQTAEALYNSDAPVPVSASTQSDPVTQQIAQTSTQTKDAQGNVTGTQTATTTVTVTDTSTTNNVTYNITETTTITHFNENNEITGTETSTSDNQPPKRTDETTISFDDVPPAQLEEEQPEFNLETPESWGEGTCPPDEILTVQGVTFPVSWQPACDTAVQLRPIFVLFASVAAMFIVAGISRAGT